MAIIDLGKSANHSNKVFIDKAVANMDYKYGPYDSVQDAFDTLEDLEVLAVGLTVGIKTEDGIEEYWFKKACTSVTDLVKKNATSSDENGYVVEAGKTASETSAIDCDRDVQNFLEGMNSGDRLADMLGSTLDADGIVHFGKYTETLDYYVGEVDANKNDFVQYAGSTLLEYAVQNTGERHSSTGDVSVTCTHKIFYILVRAVSSVTKLSFTSDSVTEDILGDCMDVNAVEINGKIYNVFAYFSGAVNDSNPTQYTYNITL